MSDCLLDGSVLMRCLRGVKQSTGLVRELQASGELYISVLTRLDILARTLPQEEKRTLDFLDSFVNLAVDEAVADMAGRLLHMQAKQGQRLSVPDAIIAATAMRRGLTLVGHNLERLRSLSELKTRTA
jgi:tRNA(fMet)-specific endonuclease VapC